MRLQPRLLAAVVAALLVLPAAGVSAAPRHVRASFRQKPTAPKLPRDFAQWSRVAVCESGGWVVLGWSYPDSLGITRTNYLAFGGRPQPPGRVSRAGIVAQIRVADRLIHHYGISIPDQTGCTGSW
jgi:hypothetical protein